MESLRIRGDQKSFVRFNFSRRPKFFSMMSFISFYKRKGPQNLLPSKLACLKGLEMQVLIFTKRIVA